MTSSLRGDNPQRACDDVVDSPNQAQGTKHEISSFLCSFASWSVVSRFFHSLLFFSFAFELSFVSLESKHFLVI